MPELQQIVNSMLWAAYGDALGFMSELVDQTGLQHRTGKPRVTDLVDWKLRVGGRYGPTVTIPAGMYSDDTQLRLATARCIDQSGNFDVDAFAKVELPVWLCYALGGGRGTKAAATNLSRDNIRWFANFYSSGDTRYVSGGGNGAAMRIQPHVWAAPRNQDVHAMILDVVRNTITTHGHPRAIVGAVFYAHVLTNTVRQAEIPGPHEWQPVLSAVEALPRQLSEDDYLAGMWLPEWERQTLHSFADATTRAVDECRAALKNFVNTEDSPTRRYETFVDVIGGRDPKTRGAGTTSVLAAVVLAWLFRSEPQEGLRVAANFLGSDTDTIASMAGALLGAATNTPSPEVRDSALLTSLAKRLHSISKGEVTDGFGHPSLLSWKPPRTALDAVGRVGDQLALAGLGKLKFIDDVVVSNNDRTPALWRWTTSEFGQSMLIKFRPEPRPLDLDQLPTAEPPSSPRSSTPPAPTEVDSKRQLAMFKQPKTPSNTETPSIGAPADLDEYTQIVIRSHFDPKTIGELLLRVADQTDGIERAIGFAAIVAKARVRRARASRG